jgi:hypothetical protein
LTVYEFDEGVTITAAGSPHEVLVGAQITAIAGTPIADVLAAIEPLVPRDGQVGVSTRYWEFAEPDDPRLTIEPDIPIAAIAEDFLAGGDPVLDAGTRGVAAGSFRIRDLHQVRNRAHTGRFLYSRVWPARS